MHDQEKNGEAFSLGQVRVKPSSGDSRDTNSPHHAWPGIEALGLGQVRVGTLTHPIMHGQE